MPLVLAKCTECGGTIKIESEKKLGICEHCGEPFVVEDAINNFTNYYTTNYITNNNTNHNYGDGAVVNVYEDSNRSFVIEAGVLKEYHGESVDVVVPEGVKYIDENCFNGMSIESIQLPSSLKELNNSLHCISPRLNTIEVSEDNDVYSVEDNVLIHHFENNKNTVEYIAGNKDSYTIPDYISGMKPMEYYSLNHLYWNNYDLCNLSCKDEEAVEARIKDNFPYTIKHNFVDYRCKDCGKYDFDSEYHLITDPDAYCDAGVWIRFAGTETAQLEVKKGNHIEFFHDYRIDEIKDSLLNKIKNAKKLILLSLNVSNDDFKLAFYNDKSLHYDQIEGYRNLLGLFGGLTELIIEQDTTYYDEKQEKVFSVLGDIIKATDIPDKCPKPTFGKNVPEETKKGFGKHMDTKAY